MLAKTSQTAACRSGVDSRNQARRFPHPGRARRRPCPADYPERLRPSPAAAAAIAALPARSCIVDSEAIACDANGLSVFDLLRYRRQDDAVTLCAFDLLELDGVDLRSEPIEVRKRTLEGLLRRQQRGIAFNRHFDGEGAIIYKHACALGCEGIVSKRLGSPYRSGRQDCWIKVKNPAAPAMLREAEEDWG